MIQDRPDVTGVRVPSPQSFSRASELADALADALRATPLTGPASSVTKEVREWGQSSGPDEEGELLDRYNAAAESEPRRLLDELAELASDPLGREGIISLLAHAGASVPARQLALQALEGKVEPSDVSLLVRVSLRQRPQVLALALPLIASTGVAEALFALRKVFGVREDEIAAQANELAGRLEESVPEAGALRHRLGDSVSETASVPPSRATLFALLSLDSEHQQAVSTGGLDVASVRELGPIVGEVHAELREQGRSPSGLNPYEARLRDELLEFVLVSGWDVDDELSRRASDNLFRREDTYDVEQLLPYLRENALRNYVERSLAREHRTGKREDRALASLRALRGADDLIRRDFVPVALEALGESSEPLLFEAVRFLAGEQARLAPSDRARLLESYEALSGSYRVRMAGDLDRSMAMEAKTIDGFLAWIGADDAGDLNDRVDALLERWAGETDASTEEASAYLTAFGRVLSRLPEQDRERAENQLVDAASAWLRAQGGVIREPVRALVRWVRFREIAVSRFPSFAERLKADQARGLLEEAIGDEGGVSTELLARASSVELSADFEERLLVPVLADCIATDPGAGRAVAEDATPQAAPRLLAAGLTAAASLQSELSRRRRALKLGTTETLERHKAEILHAVDEAVEAGEGNERLEELLAVIRRAVAGEAVPPADTPDAPERSPTDGSVV